MDDDSPAHTVDRVVGLRLRQFQRATGLPVVFGGATAGDRSGRRLRISHTLGTLGTGLLDLDVRSGRGLGGSAIETGSVRRVRDYASTTAITHDFDGVVVQQERIGSIVALPIMVGRTVEAVIYGGMRGREQIGDLVVDRATSFAARLQSQLGTLLATRTAEPPALRHTRAAITELAELAGATRDGARRAEIERLVAGLRALAPAEPDVPPAAHPLAPRELDVLRLVAVGMANREVAAALGLTTETVRSYLRAAMRKLGVGNRTAAVHAARQRGAL
jgi:LuxR family transcriptional regulator, regulator of acetate metabolism